MPKSRGTKNRSKARSVKMPPPAQEALERQLARFREKFGPDPKAGEPIYFDPAANVPTPMSMVRYDAELFEAMRTAGTPPEFVYAYKKTGLLGFGDMSAWPADRRNEWNAAVAEFLALQKLAEGKTRPDPQLWHTEIPELEACPISREDHERVMECLNAFAPVQGREPGMSVFARMELAAALLADACSSAYRSAAAQGAPDEGPARYAAFEDLVLRRAREIYAQGRA